MVVHDGALYWEYLGQGVACLSLPIFLSMRLPAINWQKIFSERKFEAIPEPALQLGRERFGDA
jgi:hypothetical protein